MISKKLLFTAALGAVLTLALNADVAPTSRGAGRTAAPAASAPAAGAAPVSARAGARQTQVSPTASAAAPSASAAAPVSARAGTRQTPTASSAPAAAAPGAPVAARAGTKVSTINKGVSVAAATAATGLYAEECRTAFEGCLDQFCYIDNENGARCSCSDDRADIDKMTAEIDALENKARNISTIGVEKAALGAQADIIFGQGQRQYDAQGNIIGTNHTGTAKKEKKTLTFSDMDDEDEEDDEFDAAVVGGLATKVGVAKFRGAYDMCKTSIPQNCSKDIAMLLQLYQTQIKSDCSAYRIELQSRKKQMELKVLEAEKMVRDTALETFEEQNKWNRGECMLEFRKCMVDKERGGCGTDFSGCAGSVALANMQNQQASQTFAGQVKDEGIDIKFADSTMEVLNSKRFICERVLDSCQAVRQFVWGDFLREIAPTMKQAELNAEANLRSNCLGTISDCVRNACQSDIAGTGVSMDACLAQPDMARSFCKVQLEPCERMEAGIWEFVKAKLGAMRVDACTDEVKNCFTNDNRCGGSYTGCIGLDLASLKDICPLEALPVCTKSGSITAWDPDISKLVMGIFLNVDNSMLTECQNLVDAKMNEVCGSTTECNAFASDEKLGSGSLRGQKLNGGDYIVSGLLQFGLIEVKDKGNRFMEIDIEGYMTAISGMSNITALKDSAASTDEIKETIQTELKNIQGQINRVMDMVKNDPKISMCINGRDMSQINGKGQTEARFPNLLMSLSASVANSALARASDNYQKKLKEELKKASEGASEELANYKCIRSIETNMANKTESSESFSPIAILFPSVLTPDQVAQLKQVSTRVENNQNGEDWVTWASSNRICTFHRTSRVCKKEAYGFAYLKSKTVCSDPKETTSELNM
ncbi:MAG: hypothetical protein LBG89_01325 [Rickettsiales bacterium]|jgi:hypothetical protein|nr:hypothetical protein [Rickettsiales bacterium]